MNNKTSNILEKYFYYKKNNNGDDMNEQMNRLSLADHEQRMFMDGLRYMLEAMIENENEVAEAYSKMHPDLTLSYEKYKEMSFKELIEERLNQNGYSPDDDVDDLLRKNLSSL
jgi:hypothetical protein